MEEQIIFGGEKKLKAAIQEAYDIFKPKAISIYSTCPVGLIGDDVHAVAREMKEKLGINVFAFSCEGYKGVSQSAGHHIANNGVFKHMVGRDDTPVRGRVHDQRPGRIQHRRRCLGDRHAAPEMRHQGGCHAERRRQLRPGLPGAHGATQYRHVPSLDQLHGRDDGEEIRHSVVQGELHRRRIDGEIAPENRQVFRQQEADRPRGGSHRPGDGRAAPDKDAVDRPLQRQEGRAIRGRLPGAPLPGSLLRHRHGNHRRGLRICPPRRLRRPACAPDDQDRRR